MFYKPICQRCGLMRLRNPITQWCVKHGCYHEDHPLYKRKLKELTGWVTRKRITI
jgi:hypothetical protein